MHLFFRLTVFVVRIFFRLCYRYKFYIHTPIYSKGAIIAANHASFLDPPLIGVSWPEETYYLARATLFDSWFLRFLLSHLNTHPIQGSVQDLSSFKTVRQLIQQNKKVVIFPEGARTEDGHLQQIKTGVAMLALHTQCPIIPTYVRGTYEAWSRKRRWPSLGTSITCVFGQPIFTENYSHLDKKEARQAITEQLKQSIENLRLWYEHGAHGDPP